MNRCSKILFSPSALILSLGLIQSDQLKAQTFTTLHGFTGGSGGAFPVYSRLLLSGGRLYGTTEGDFLYGGSGYGTVFVVNTDGTGFTTLYRFSPGSASSPATNFDGIAPVGGLLLSGNTLYGTAWAGGSLASGTVFSLNTNGTGFTTLYNFTAIADPSGINSDGAFPLAGLILSGNTLYGTTSSGGSSGYGTVFAVGTDGTGFTNLYSFTGGSDGAGPYAGLILSGKTLYGTAHSGGDSGRGTVFALGTDGTGFATLHSFTEIDPATHTNSDGTGPYAGSLLLSGNSLFGTTSGGGSAGNGTIFAVKADGSVFTTLHSFTAIPDLGSPNSDGAKPEAGLVLSGNSLYGTAPFGGSFANGTVFAINTDGTGFTTLHSFMPSSTNASGVFTNSNGASPFAGLVLLSNTLYGTAHSGGSSGNGTVFSISLESVNAPQLAIIPSGTNVILTWPTNATEFTLQSTTNFVSAGLWTPVFPAAVVVNGLNTVTNFISRTQTFYRLSQ